MLNYIYLKKRITDHLIHAELYLPQGEDMKAAKVVGCTKDEDGNIIGTYDYDPMLKSMVYDVEFPDREIKEYSANIIAQNMYAQVDANGHHHTLLDSIVDYEKLNNAVDKADQYLTTKKGTRRMYQTTKD